MNYVLLFVRVLSGYGYLKFKYIEILLERIVLYKNNYIILLWINGNYEMLMVWKIIFIILSWFND